MRGIITCYRVGYQHNNKYFSNEYVNQVTNAQSLAICQFIQIRNRKLT